MKITEFLRLEDVVANVAEPSKARVLQFLASRAGKALGVDPGKILGALENRERLGSTGFGRGIAIPHTSIGGLKKPLYLLCRLSKAVDFEAIDDMPVDIVFLLLTPEEDRSLHLKVSFCISRQLRDDDIVKRIRKAGTSADIYAAVSARLHDLPVAAAGRAFAPFPYEKGTTNPRARYGTPTPLGASMQAPDVVESRNVQTIVNFP